MVLHMKKNGGQLLHPGTMYTIEKGTCQTEWKIAKDVTERECGDVSQLDTTIRQLNEQKTITSEFSQSNATNLQLKSRKRNKVSPVENKCSGQVPQLYENSHLFWISQSQMQQECQQHLYQPSLHLNHGMHLQQLLDPYRK